MTDEEWAEWNEKAKAIHVPPPIPWSIASRIAAAENAAEDEPDGCAACGGELTVLGQLGNRKHYRCRDCGIDQSEEVNDG